MVKVSVIVPVYNPGSNMDDLVRSVLEQSLPKDEYEAVFVDDGSTDGTGARLAALADQHSFIKVRHIPNSGWPSRPRNIGTDMAQGEYVLYADNDDYLAPQALERMYERAVADGADVLVGKVVGHDKFVARDLFRENRSHVTVEWEPLIRLLSPHKLFRRAFLDEHAIRFPEDTRRLEDHVFVMKAFFAAQDRISILADYPCYHWMLRPAKDNASFAKMEPVSYFNSLRQVLDVVEANTLEGSRERERLLAHWYRSKALWRLTGAVFLRREEDFNRAIYDEVLRITRERFPPPLDRFLPFGLKMRSHILRGDDLEGIYAMARFEAGLRGRIRVTELRYTGDGAAVTFEARLRGGLQVARDGERLLWQPPDELRPHLEGADLDVTKSVSHAIVQPLLRAVSDKTEHVLDPAMEVRVDDRGVPAVTARAHVPADLEPGEWQLVVPVRIMGFHHTAMTVRQGEGRPAPLTFRVRRAGRLDRPSWTRRHLSGRAPRLARAIRRVAGGGRSR